MANKHPAVSLSDRGLNESAKTLRANIDFAGIDAPIRSVAITSAEKGDGKTIIACMLAIAEATADRKTLIVDNDFRNPQVSARLNVHGTHKLSELLNATEETFMDFCMPTKVPNLYVLDVGLRRSDPVEVLSSQKYDRILDLAKSLFDFVVIDTPPLGLFIDAAIVAPKTDGTLIVVRSGKDTPQSLQSVMSQLEKANARVLGAVLNGANVRNTSYYYYYYYSSKEHKAKRRSHNRH